MTVKSFKKKSGYDLKLQIKKNLGLLPKASPSFKWKDLVKHRHLLIPTHPILRVDSKVFCIGSCFALEVKKTLDGMGFQALPQENGIGIPLPEGGVYVSQGRQLVHYNTYTIRQEFEKAFGYWNQPDDDFWRIPAQKKETASEKHYWDPYRREVSTKTLAGIQKITHEFDRLMREGILTSDLYIITLGLTEVWRKKNNGRYAYANPGGVSDQIEFHLSTFEENYANIRQIAFWIGEHFPEKKIILSVSPVALTRTFTSSDVSLANTESKSILRAVAGQVAREFCNVLYFPSYEICQLHEKFRTRKVYRDDHRHVTRDTVGSIMEFFIDRFGTEDVKELQKKSPSVFDWSYQVRDWIGAVTSPKRWFF